VSSKTSVSQMISQMTLIRGEPLHTLLVSDRDDMGQIHEHLEPMMSVIPIGEGEENEQPKVSIVQAMIRREMIPHWGKDFTGPDGEQRLDDLLVQIACTLTNRHKHGIRVTDLVPRPRDQVQQMASQAVADASTSMVLANRTIVAACSQRVWNCTTPVLPDLRKGPATCLVFKGDKQSHINGFAYGTVLARNGLRLTTEMGGFLHSIAATRVVFFKGYNLPCSFAVHPHAGARYGLRVNLKQLGGVWKVYGIGQPVKFEKRDTHLDTDDEKRAVVARLTPKSSTRLIASVRNVVTGTSGDQHAVATIAKPEEQLHQSLYFEVANHRVFRNLMVLTAEGRHKYAVGQCFEIDGLQVVNWVEGFTSSGAARAWVWVRGEDGRLIDDITAHVTAAHAEIPNDAQQVADTTLCEEDDITDWCHELARPNDLPAAAPEARNTRFVNKLTTLEQLLRRHEEYNLSTALGHTTQVRVSQFGVAIEHGTRKRFIDYDKIPPPRGTWSQYLGIDCCEVTKRAERDAIALLDEQHEDGDLDQLNALEEDDEVQPMLTVSIDHPTSVVGALAQVRDIALGLPVHKSSVSAKYGHQDLHVEIPEQDEFVVVAVKNPNEHDEELDHHLWTEGLGADVMADEGNGEFDDVNELEEVGEDIVGWYGHVDTDRPPRLFRFEDCGKVYMHPRDVDEAHAGDCSWDSVMGVVIVGDKRQVLRILLDTGCCAGAQKEKRKWRTVTVRDRQREVYVSRSHRTHTNVTLKTARAMEKMGVQFESAGGEPITVSGVTGAATDYNPQIGKIKLGFMDWRTGDVTVTYDIRVYVNPNMINKRYNILLGIIDTVRLGYRAGGIDRPYVTFKALGNRTHVSQWCYQPDLGPVMKGERYEAPKCYTARSGPSDGSSMDTSEWSSDGDLLQQVAALDTVHEAEILDGSDQVKGTITKTATERKPWVRKKPRRSDDDRWYKVTIPLDAGTLVVLSCMDKRLQFADEKGRWLVPTMHVPPGGEINFQLVPKGASVAKYPGTVPVRVSILKGKAQSFDVEANAHQALKETDTRLQDMDEDRISESDPRETMEINLAQYKQRHIVTEPNGPETEQRIQDEERDFYRDGIPVASQEWTDKVYDRLTDIPEDIMNKLVQSIMDEDAGEEDPLDRGDAMRILDLYYEATAASRKDRFHADGQDIEKAITVGLEIVDLADCPDVSGSGAGTVDSSRATRLIMMLLHREVHLGHLMYVMGPGNEALVRLVAKVMRAMRKGKVSGRLVYSLLLYNSMNRDIPACDAVMQRAQRLLRGAHGAIGILERDVARCYNHVGIAPELRPYLGVKGGALLLTALRAALGMRNIPAIWSHVASRLNALRTNDAAERRFLKDVIILYKADKRNPGANWQPKTGGITSRWGCNATNSTPEDHREAQTQPSVPEQPGRTIGGEDEGGGAAKKLSNHAGTEDLGHGRSHDQGHTNPSRVRSGRKTEAGGAADSNVQEEDQKQGGAAMDSI